MRSPHFKGSKRPSRGLYYWQSLNEERQGRGQGRVRRQIGGKASSTPPAPAGKTKSAKDAQDEKEKKEKDNVAKLKDRLAKGHRLNDQELAQLELAAICESLTDMPSVVARAALPEGGPAGSAPK